MADNGPKTSTMVTSMVHSHWHLGLLADCQTGCLKGVNMLAGKSSVFLTLLEISCHCIIQLMTAKKAT